VPVARAIADSRVLQRRILRLALALALSAETIAVELEALAPSRGAHAENMDMLSKQLVQTAEVCRQFIVRMRAVDEPDHG
jgi:hypothetical protein